MNCRFFMKQWSAHVHFERLCTLDNKCHPVYSHSLAFSHIHLQCTMYGGGCQVNKRSDNIKKSERKEMVSIHFLSKCATIDDILNFQSIAKSHNLENYTYIGSRGGDILLSCNTCRPRLPALTPLTSKLTKKRRRDDTDDILYDSITSQLNKVKLSTLGGEFNDDRFQRMTISLLQLLRMKDTHSESCPVESWYVCPVLVCNNTLHVQYLYLMYDQVGISTRKKRMGSQ